MLKRTIYLPVALLICCLAYQPSASAQSNNTSLAHLTIYNANLGEFLEERTIELQPGYNTVEWRSLMPKANIRTVRVLAEDAEVVRQDVTYDGPQVNNERSPVLHLVIQNRGATARKRIQVDYLAANISWQAAYSLVLEPTAKDQAPTAATLDSWVSLHNNTGVDIAAGAVDLVAGEIALLTGDGDSRPQYASQMSVNTSNYSASSSEESTETSDAVSSLSAFNRFTLGNDIKLNANSLISRFPIFQHAKLNIVQRNVFENEHSLQTLGRGDFILLPRGLEVRLVAKNTASAPMAAGLVTIYQRQGSLGQIVGQDRVPFIPQNGEFTVGQGLSGVLFGTRRILEHRAFGYEKDNKHHDRLVTKVEVVLTNRGTQAAEAFVRENIEKYGDNQWKIIESTTPSEIIGSNNVQFKVTVPAGGKITIVYTVESE